MPDFILAKLQFTKRIVVLVLITMSNLTVYGDWKINVSHESTNMRGEQLKVVPQETESPTFSPIPYTPFSVYRHQSPLQKETQEIVLLLTEQGFVPKEIYLKINQRYKITVVNVNESQKHSSFVLEKFSQFHGTYFGKVVSFDFEPTQEGAFSFLCPENNQHGKLVIFRQQEKMPNYRENAKRMISSEAAE